MSAKGGTRGDSPPSSLGSSRRRRLGGIVELYLHKKLPRDSHPAFKALRDREEAAVTVSQSADSKGTSPGLVVGQEQELEDSPRNLEDKDEDSLEELSRSVENEKQLFKLTLETYEKTTTGSKFKTEVTSKSLHTWEEVLDEVRKASESYNSAAGSWGKIRRALRSFGKNSKAFKAWTDLLPSESEYFSILCGGLKLIIGAAARMEDLRTDICEALEEIPILIKSTNSTMELFAPSTELRLSSLALYSATIAALHHIVAWYKEKAMKRMFKSIFKQDTYEKKLSDLLQAVRQQSARFDRSAQLCSYETIMNTSQMIRSHDKRSSENQQIALGYLRQSHSEFHAFRNDFASGKGDVQRDVKAIGSQVSDMHDQISHLREILAEFLSSNARIDPRTQDVRGPMLPLRKVVSESNLIRDYPGVEDALLSAFKYESSVIRRDVEACLRAVWTLPRVDQDRIIVTMQSPQLHQWIAETESSALFLNSNAPRNQRPGSFVSAKLVDSIQTMGTKAQGHASSVFALSFFCGEHMRSNDPDVGVDGMMRSLICQLLLAYPDFGSHIVDRIRNANYSTMDDLCKIFYLLAIQLPPHVMVFCIIDAVTFYEENKSMRKEGEIAVKKLMEIVQWTKNYGCVFKLLLTSPWNSRVLYKHMFDQQKDVIWIPAKVPSTGGFTNMKWNSSIGSDVAMLKP